MERIEELKKLYNNSIKKELDVLAQEKRKKLTSWYVIIFYTTPFILLFISVFLSIIALIGVIAYISTVNEKTHKKTESILIPSILRIINPTWIFYPNESIGKDVFKTSGIFIEKNDSNYSYSYDGDKMIVGMVEKTNFYSSRMIMKEYYENNKDNNKTNTTTTVFSGLVCSYDFNKNFNHNTLVTTHRASRYCLRESEKVILEDVLFNKEFSVSSSNQIEARYILTPSMMNRLLKLKASLKVDFYISFINNRMFLALNNFDKIFHINSLKKIDINEIQKITSMFSVFEEIVNELDLNTRIWTKK